MHIPKAVLRSMVHSGQIPTLTVKWADNRVCCRRARQDDPRGACGCASLARNSDGTRWCRLNGAAAASLCVYDEPESAEVWARIREQQEAAR